MGNNQEISSFIWNVCDDVLRGLFKQHEYGDVILPFVVLRRLDCIIEPNKDKVIELYNELKDEVSEYYLDRLDFHKMIMNTKVYPMNLEGMYREYTRELRR